MVPHSKELGVAGGHPPPLLAASVWVVLGLPVERSQVKPGDVGADRPRTTPGGWQGNFSVPHGRSTYTAASIDAGRKGGTGSAIVIPTSCCRLRMAELSTAKNRLLLLVTYGCCRRFTPV